MAPTLFDPSHTVSSTVVSIVPSVDVSGRNPERKYHRMLTDISARGTMISGQARRKFHEMSLFVVHTADIYRARIAFFEDGTLTSSDRLQTPDVGHTTNAVSNRTPAGLISFQARASDVWLSLLSQAPTSILVCFKSKCTIGWLGELPSPRLRSFAKYLHASAFLTF